LDQLLQPFFPARIALAQSTTGGFSLFLMALVCIGAQQITIGNKI
jgi:hypothetical protein